MVAEGPYAGEQAAMPEGVDGGGWDIEADSSAGFADVFVAESGAQTQGDYARKPRNDCENDALLEGVGGGHTLSLPLLWAWGTSYRVQVFSSQFSVVSWRGTKLRTEN